MRHHQPKRGQPALIAVALAGMLAAALGLGCDLLPADSSPDAPPTDAPTDAPADGPPTDAPDAPYASGMSVAVALEGTLVARTCYAGDSNPSSTSYLGIAMASETATIACPGDDVVAAAGGCKLVLADVASLPATFAFAAPAADFDLICRLDPTGIGNVIVVTAAEAHAIALEGTWDATARVLQATYSATWRYPNSTSVRGSASGELDVLLP